MKTFKTAKGTELPILNLRGKDYLEVKFRLVWFREEHPDWGIETELLSTSERASCVRATIRNASGRIVAMGHKSETAQGFPDHMEKSETGAIGRALALCGYGTQFCADDLDEGSRIVDSPIGRQPPVSPDQPSSDDGNTEPTQYKIPFGKWAQRTLEEVHRNHGSDAMADYIDYIKESAKKKNQPLTGPAADFVVKATQFLNAMEGNEPGARG